MRRLAECLSRWQPGADRPTVRRAVSLSPAGAAPTPPTAPEEAEPLDPATLESLRAIAGGNDAMLDRIFGLFLSHAPARLAALQEAIGKSDLPRAAAEAHALKSPSLNIGALRLGGLCATLESRARAADVALLADDSVAAVKRELDAVIAAIGTARSPASRAAS
jgi:HPt (histidine-containing phosphotransfer) domain-containing protein